MNLYVFNKQLSFLPIFFIGLFILIFKPSIVLSDPVENQYYFAEKFYCNFTKHLEQYKYREKWLLCIDEFKKVDKLDPSGPWAAAGLYKAGLLYIELYKLSSLKSDITEALDIFKRIRKRFPKSLYNRKVDILLNQIAKQKNCSIDLKKYDFDNKQINKYKKLFDDNIHQIKDSKVNFKIDNVLVKMLRVWSNPTYTRIVIDLDKETSFTHQLFDQKLIKTGLQKLYLDLNNSKLDKNISNSVQINDKLLKNVIAHQHTSDIVRVFVEIKSFNSYRVFTLKNPFRIVIDIMSGEDKKCDKIFSKDAMLHQLSLGVDKIVIDPGHGGKDHGAIGILEGIYEKDITLQLARCLAIKIRNQLGCKVVMTRETDKYLSLEERTAIANTENADLFISIHTNASKNKKAYGIETFFLNLAIDDEAILIAARENSTSSKNISDLESILSNIMHNSKIYESNRLALNVQNSLCSYITDRYDNINNKGVKQAPFYVLLGAQMPAVLIETSFISNHRECNRLRDLSYQESICEGIIIGIKQYIELK